MNAAPILWSGADRFGREARAGDGGALGGPGWSGAGVAAVRLSRPDARKREDAPTLAAKSYTTHHLSIGVGRCVALSNTNTLLNTHTHTHTHTQVHRIGISCECEATGREIQMEYVQEEKR